MAVFMHFKSKRQSAINTVPSLSLLIPISFFGKKFPHAHVQYGSQLSMPPIQQKETAF